MTHIRSRPQEVTVAEYGKLYTDLHDQHSAFLNRYQDYITRSNATINSLCEENRALKAELTALRNHKLNGTFTPNSQLITKETIERNTPFTSTGTVTQVSLEPTSTGVVVYKSDGIIWVKDV